MSSEAPTNYPHLVAPPVPNRSSDDEWWQHFHHSMVLSQWQPPVWDRVCTYCDAPLLKGERPEFCCNRGSRIIPPLPPLPETIGLLQSARQASALSRRANNLFSFTAIGASVGFQKFRTGLANVAVTGRTYHRIFDIATPNHSIHWFLYDENDREAAGETWNVPLNFIQDITSDLNNVNPYVDHLHHFASTWQHTPEATSALELSDVSTGGDFAAIIHANNTTNVKPRSILIHRKTTNQPAFIPIFSRHYEPLQYPLFFPQGSLGWGLTSDPENPNTLHRSLPFTQREWYKGRILADSRFLAFGRLGSEYLCDMYSRIEEERLQFIRRGRLSHAQEIDPDGDLSSVPIHLPASFLGSKEWASNETADALALARQYGRPSLFITMTCNGDWPEVTSRLRPGQSAYDVPVIVARAFKARLQRLLQLLRTKFGNLVYIIKVIEFQKRGFPHVHILLKVILIML
jgi:hypothetical protein